MFLHNLKYSFKTLFRNRMLIFWTYAFPIILGTFFYLAFSNIENSEKLDIIDIAIIDNEEFNNNEVLKESFKVLSDEENEEQLFNTVYVNEDKAKKLLDKSEISGYLLFEENVSINVKSSGTNETIIKYVTEEIIQNQEILSNSIEEKLSQITNYSEIEQMTNQIYNEVLVV